MWTIRQLRWSVWGVLLITAAWTVLTAAGIFDPRPRGRQQGAWPARRFSLAAGETVRLWLPDGASPLTDARMTGSAEDADAAYGLLLDDGQALWAVAVSGRGYVAVWEERDGKTLWQRPWQPWLHVAADRPNELWVAVGADGVTVRINRELLGQFPLPTAAGRCAPCRLGVWAQAPRSAVVTLGPVIRFAPDDDGGE